MKLDSEPHFVGTALLVLGQGHAQLLAYFLADE